MHRSKSLAPATPLPVGVRALSAFWIAILGLGLAACEGAVGPAGPTGPAGADGSNGTSGPTGPQGNAGANGRDGTDARPCSVRDNTDGTATITCPDGSSVIVGVPRDFAASIAVRWNQVALAAVRGSTLGPPMVARALYIVHASIYEAWAAYEETAVGPHSGRSLKRPEAERTRNNQETAISYAAYQALNDLFRPFEDRTQSFRRLMDELQLPLSASREPSTPAGLGNLAAETVIDARRNDNANQLGGYAAMTSTTYPNAYVSLNRADPSTGRAPGGAQFDRNRWQPLRVPTGIVTDSSGLPIVDTARPESFRDQGYLGVTWGAVVPFALGNPQRILPRPPPMHGNTNPYLDYSGRTTTFHQAWIDQHNELVQIAAGLSDRQKVIAEYWADGPNSETPPGHWNLLARGVSFRDRHTLAEDVKMYFLLNAALMDASIATWYTKRVYDCVRPISAIRDYYFAEAIPMWGGPNRGTVSGPGAEWRPYQSLTFVTPPFPGYTSGHSAFSAAAAEVLTRFTGSPNFYDAATVLPWDDNLDGVRDRLGEHVQPAGTGRFERMPASMVVLSWRTFQDAADEAGVSRLYGGIHIREDDISGRALGRFAANRAWIKAQRLFEGR